MIGTAEGSEIRFAGRHEVNRGVLTGEEVSRLSFRKSNKVWVYVSGLGQYEEGGKVTRLGHSRSVNTCLALLGSGDPILREGAARDLGRLVGTTDVARAVSKLTPLLNDTSPFVRRGTAEGLGLIGSVEAFNALRDALATEKDATTKSYIEEAMGIAGAYALLNDSISQNIPLEQASDFVSKLIPKGEITDWTGMVITTRIAPRREQAMTALARHAASTADGWAAAARSLKGALDKLAAK
jgi:hypothetical protein